MGKLRVNRVKSETHPGKYYDGANLHLYIKLNGTKYWQFRYVRNGRERTLGLGPARDGDVGLHEAREKAADLRKALRAGLDPSAEKRTRQLATVTFEKCARDFHKDQGQKRSAKWYHQWLRELETHAFVKIGAYPVAGIDEPAIVSVLQPIWRAKPVVAKRLRKNIERVLNFATFKKLRSGDNPARWEGHLEHSGLPKVETEEKHHAALSWSKMRDFMVKLRSPSDALNLDALALEFLILTAARTSEVLLARWDEIQGDVWIIPAQRMKAGKEHRVPLSRRAAELLASLPRDNGNFVFPSAKAGRPLAPIAMLSAGKRLAGPSFTVHGLRSSFSDWARENTSFLPHLVEMALAHKLGPVEAAYARGDLFDKRRELMEAWATYLEPKVVQLRKASA